MLIHFVDIVTVLQPLAANSPADYLPDSQQSDTQSHGGGLLHSQGYGGLSLVPTTRLNPLAYQ